MWTLGSARNMRNGAAGSTLVEFALAAPLALALVFGALDFGRLVFARLSLRSAVAEAARFGITGRRLPDPKRPDLTLSRADSIRALVARFAPGMDPAEIEVQIRQLDADGRPVAIEPENLGGGEMETLIVEARYPYRVLHLFLGDAFTVPLEAKAVMRNERFRRLER